MYSLTSLRARLRIIWLRSSLRGRSGKLITQSGWARYRSLLALTISGSTQRPKSIFRLLTWSIRPLSPCGNFCGLTAQSPNPARSLLRAPNQPSSITKSSTPSFAALFGERPLPRLVDSEGGGFPGVVEDGTQARGGPPGRICSRLKRWKQA